jgi:hypothetical protein
MADELETTIAPSAIERAREIFEAFKQRDHADLVKARKALTDQRIGSPKRPTTLIMFPRRRCGTRYSIRSRLSTGAAICWRSGAG